MFFPEYKLIKKDVPFLCCMLDYVGNVCEQFKEKKMKKIPVDVCVVSLGICINSLKSSLPNKTPIMLDLMCAQF